MHFDWSEFDAIRRAQPHRVKQGERERRGSAFGRSAALIARPIICLLWHILDDMFALRLMHSYRPACYNFAPQKGDRSGFLGAKPRRARRPSPKEAERE